MRQKTHKKLDNLIKMYFLQTD